MKGKKKYKNDKFACCDSCGKRVYKEKERHYKEKYACSFYLGFPTEITEVYCSNCDMSELKKMLLEKDLEAKKNVIN